ncbi:uncharacterized protein PAC_18980 [Phialocephala subalpina]|uniref:Myb-like domain-containing protein n=1 Tax=Phialocephala subalpina TaxID=576137 RepID=A0A1L7XVP7_9HELO|nr:uncharacterized protein PAC_18980 [Phialocephala subalpina]
MSIFGGVNSILAVSNIWMFAVYALSTNASTAIQGNVTITPSTTIAFSSALSIASSVSVQLVIAAEAGQGGNASSSDDESCLSDSDPDLSSDDDGCSSEDEQSRSSMSKHSRWSDLDEQCLLAHKKEGKSWELIFSKFQGRTRPAYVRAGTWSGLEATRLPPAGG